MGKGKKNKKGGGHKKGTENGNTKPPHVPDIPRTELYSIVKNLKTHLYALKQFETPKTHETPDNGRPLMKQLEHAPGQKNHEKASTGGLFSPSEIFDTYKKARQEILNSIHAHWSESEKLAAQQSIHATEKQFIEDLGDHVKEVRGKIDTVEQMAGYTKKLYGYLKLLMKAANKAGVSNQETCHGQLRALDSSKAGSYADVLKNDQILILELQAKKHSLLSVFYTEKANALKETPTGVEGSDSAPKAKLDKNEKEATDTFKLAQQKLWTDNNPIDKMIACIE